MGDDRERMLSGERMREAMRSRLHRVIRMIHGAHLPINCALTDDGVDVPRLELVDNGVGWELVADPSNERFDLWHDDAPVEWDLDMADAIGALTKIYITAKVRRVLAREVG